VDRKKKKMRGSGRKGIPKREEFRQKDIFEGGATHETKQSS
jgi:hypothetical protein